MRTESRVGFVKASNLSRPSLADRAQSKMKEFMRREHRLVMWARNNVFDRAGHCGKRGRPHATPIQPFTKLFN